MCNVQTTNAISVVNPYTEFPFKKIFVCLPADGLTNREIEKHLNEIEEKLKKRFPEWAFNISTAIDNLWTPEEAFIFEPKGRDSIKKLADVLLVIGGSDLVIFGVGWSESLLCSEIHSILEDNKKTVDYLYEWELDQTIEDFCKIYGSNH